MKNRNDVFIVIRKTAIQYMGLSICILLVVVGAVLTALVPPLILGSVIDRLNTQQEIAVTTILLYFLFIALTGVLESVRESLLIIFGQKITHALRSQLCGKLTNLSADEINAQEPGAVVSRFVGDVSTVETLFTSGIISMFADACKIMSILVIVWLKNRGLAILLLVLMPIIYLFTRNVQKKMLVAQTENRVAVSKVTNHVPESIRCIRTIHILGKEKYMEERYDEYIGQSYKAMEKTNFYDSIYSPVILSLNAGIVAVVMVLSASGNVDVLNFFGMSAGTAVAILNYISQVFGPLESLGMEIQTIQSAVAGVKRINEFLELQEQGQVQTNVQREVGEHCIEFRNVSFGYDEHMILEHMNFVVDAGEQVTLTGRTGAGKSTIFKLILGLYRPIEGQVLIQGQDAASIQDIQKRRLYGCVEQNFRQIPGSIRDQIALYDPDITNEMVREAAELVGMHEAICSLENGYDTVCTESLFSQGQWQLLSIARAVAGRPGILLLDEITANLDANTERIVLDALSRAANGRTVVSISHRVYGKKKGRLIRLS